MLVLGDLGRGLELGSGFVTGLTLVFRGVSVVIVGEVVVGERAILVYYRETSRLEREVYSDESIVLGRL